MTYTLIKTPADGTASGLKKSEVSGDTPNTPTTSPRFGGFLMRKPPAPGEKFILGEKRSMFCRPTIPPEDITRGNKPQTFKI